MIGSELQQQRFLSGRGWERNNKEGGKKERKERKKRKKGICSSYDAKDVTKAAASRSRQSEVMRVRDERRGKKEENTEQSLCEGEREESVRGSPPLISSVRPRAQCLPQAAKGPAGSLASQAPHSTAGISNQQRGTSWLCQ